MKFALAVRFVAVGVLAACSGARSDSRADSVVAEQRAARLNAAISDSASDSTDAPIALWKLPDRLKEISGLALTANGRLLAHGDERARIFEIDYRRGLITKEFDVGKPALHGDFESIAVVGDSVYLLDSDGTLYSFVEGANGKSVKYAKVDTDLGSRCEFESMTFDPRIQSLLLGCKRLRDKSLADSLVIFRWKLPHAASDTVSHLAVPFNRLSGSGGWKELRPSDIAIDPRTGNYVLVASREKAILAITPAGDVVFVRALPPGHRQAEGLAITRDGILIVSDEGVETPGIITLYRWKSQ